MGGEPDLPNLCVKSRVSAISEVLRCLCWARPLGSNYSGGRLGQHVEEQGNWASRTRKHTEAGGGRPVDGGMWTSKTVKRPQQQPAQPQHTNDWAPRTRKRHRQQHRPQRPTERSNPTQHAKGRTGDCSGPRKETTTRRNVTQGDCGSQFTAILPQFFSTASIQKFHFSLEEIFLTPTITRHTVTTRLCYGPSPTPVL